MRTIDTAAVIAKALERFPAGSLSKREVVATIPCSDNPEEHARELNGRLTATIYKHWQETDLLKPKAWTVARDELTRKVQDLFGE